MKLTCVLSVFTITLLVSSCTSKKKSLELLEAVKAANINTINKLLTENININIQDTQGKTPLFYAVQSAIQHEQQLDAFIKKIDPDIKKLESKINRIREKDIVLEEGKYLLKIKNTEQPFVTNKAHKLYQDYEATIQEYRKVYNFLASIHNKCDKKTTIYSIYKDLVYRDKLKFIAYLLDKKLIQTHEHYKKLEREYHDAEFIVKTLLKHDADPNKKCNSLTIAEYAKKNGSDKVYELLKKS